MKSLVCQSHCAFHKPRAEEPEKCLAFEFLKAWGEGEPRLAEALENLPPLARPDLETLAPLVTLVCGRCPFRAHGCDFAAHPNHPDAEPCGGLKVLGELLGRGWCTQADLEAPWERVLEGCYLRLAEHASLRLLETPHLYDRLGDELYELNEEGFAWLARCDGTTAGLSREADPEFLTEVLGASLLACCSSPQPRRLRCRQSPIPSLRYLEVLLTDRCNLRCGHCYLGEAGNTDLPLAAALAAFQEFEDMQGLRVLLSGGEPLLYSHWEELNARLPDFEVRFVLLTNGTLLTDALLSRLKVQEIQVSLDGLEEGHDRIRGRGSFQKAMAGLLAAQEAGLAVSAATMIHAGNLQELQELGERLRELGVKEWNLDVPCLSGRLAENLDLYLPPEVSAPYLELGFGGADHGADEQFACGRHLAALLPTGEVAKCGLFAHRPLGRLSEGLETCWRRLDHVPLTDLECARCDHLRECRGGCRFRAGEGLAPDPVMCALYGVDPANRRSCS